MSFILLKNSGKILTKFFNFEYYSKEFEYFGVRVSHFVKDYMSYIKLDKDVNSLYITLYKNHSYEYSQVFFSRNFQPSLDINLGCLNNLDNFDDAYLCLNYGRKVMDENLFLDLGECFYQNVIDILT